MIRFTFGGTASETLRFRCRAAVSSRHEWRGGRQANEGTTGYRPPMGVEPGRALVRRGNSAFQDVGRHRAAKESGAVGSKDGQCCCRVRPQPVSMRMNPVLQVSPRQSKHTRHSAPATTNWSRARIAGRTGLSACSCLPGASGWFSYRNGCSHALSGGIGVELAEQDTHVAIRRRKTPPSTQEEP